MLVHDILSKAEVSPIIIVQADHGSCSTFPDNINLVVAMEQPTEKMLRERMRIFNAYFLPQGGNDLLYSSITPVNTFRVIFNFYFGTSYELVDDQSFYSTGEHYYKFFNVTDKVRYD